jgi:site-specific DNA recombinase
MITDAEPTRKKRRKKKSASTVRCAIYCRVSSDERLDSEFNSLDAQREAGEAYVASQKSQGWLLVENEYSDPGFSGGTLERPALKRLMQDIKAGQIDAVICYKVDRLSRSLLDFSKLMDTFDEHETAFVSVTQTINTGTSSGRLMLNILLSFAQFERELCGERIRDKIAAQRRRGKWAGGNPVLGYDVDRSGQSPKLVINAAEAKRVRKIFELYLKLGSLLPVVDELEKRHWCNKAWTTQKGKPKGGKPFDKGTLHSLLTNPIYIGKIKHKTEVYEGEHEPIIDAEVFREVQNALRRNGRESVTRVRNKHGALLKGLLTCTACDRAMVHSFTGKENKRYRYYRCANELKNGRKACPTRSLPAPEIEQAVVDEIRIIAEDAELRKEVWQQTKAHFETERKAIDTERRELERQLKRDQKDIQRLSTKGDRTSVTLDLLADLNERVCRAESRLLDLHARVAELDQQNVTRADVDAAFADFDNVWSELSPREQARLLNLLIASVEFDGTDSSLAVTFQPSNIRTLAHREDG